MRVAPGRLSRRAKPNREKSSFFEDAFSRMRQKIRSFRAWMLFIAVLFTLHPRHHAASSSSPHSSRRAAHRTWLLAKKLKNVGSIDILATSKQKQAVEEAGVFHKKKAASLVCYFLFSFSRSPAAGASRRFFCTSVFAIRVHIAPPPHYVRLMMKRRVVLEKQTGGRGESSIRSN